MLSGLCKLPLFGKSHPVGLDRSQRPVIPVGLGHSREKKTSYYWNGLQRGRLPFVVIQYTLAGRGQMDRHGQTYSIQPGDMMLAPIPDAHCYYLPPGGDPWEFVYVCVEGAWVVRECKELVTRRGPVWKADTRAIEETFLQLLTHSTGKGGVQVTWQSFALSYALILAISEAATDEGEESPKQGLDQARRFCQRRYADPIGVEEMAEAASMSRAHFSRKFKRRYGVSPGSYLLSVRLDASAKALLEEETPVKEIAYRSGFADPNYFCKIFRKRYGESPGTYRKSGRVQ